MLKKISKFEFEFRSEYGGRWYGRYDYTETYPMVKIGKYAFSLEIVDAVIDHPNISILLDKLNADFINKNIAVSYASLYEFSKRFCADENDIYIPHFNLLSIDIENETEITFGFVLNESTIGIEPNPLFFSVCFEGDVIVDITWATY